VAWWLKPLHDVLLDTVLSYPKLFADVRVAPRTVGILLWREVGFEDRFQHQHCCCHADPITQGRTNRDLWISHIRLSDKSSRLHPRHVVPKPA
jgi:hypothetical protein